MSLWAWIGVVVGLVGVLYGLVLAALAVGGRRVDAKAVLRFIPDCVVLFRRLAGDRRVPRSRKVLLVAMLGYLAMPLDVVPDVLPVVGQLDDAILVALVLRSVLRAAGRDVAREHWPGAPDTLDVLLRSAFGRTVTSP